MRSTPLATALGLLATVVLTTGAVAGFLACAPAPLAAYLLLFMGLFAVRVAGQVAVVLSRPSWLPPMEQWNFVPYPVLLPAQLVILGIMALTIRGHVEPGHDVAELIVALALAYWSAMAGRYALRMLRRPSERWLGGTIPIVFHCVLAAFLFVFGAAHA